MLYGCETWSHILREERSLRLFENRILRQTFGPWRDEIVSEESHTTRNFIVCIVCPG